LAEMNKPRNYQSPAAAKMNGRISPSLTSEKLLFSNRKKVKDRENS
jgi:hypothetical protein